MNILVALHTLILHNKDMANKFSNVQKKIQSYISLRISEDKQNYLLLPHKLYK